MQVLNDSAVLQTRGTATFNKPIRNAFLALVAISALAPSTGRATETIVPVTPPGATDVDQAFLPSTGVYLGAVVIPFSSNSNTYDNHGQPVPPQGQVRIDTQIYAPLALYVYPFKLFGGSLASSFVQPLQQFNYSIGASPTFREFGFADAYSDVVYWAKNVGLWGATPGRIPLSYGLSVGAGFALIVPDGDYSRNNALRLGGHSWVLDPNVALTYNTGPRLSFGDNTQLSARFFYAMPQQDWTTHYTSGNIVDLDWSVSEQFGKLRFGVAGFYQKQVTDDNPGNGIRLPKGNRYTAAGVGPVVEYFLPQWGAVLKAKYTDTFEHKNYVDQQLVVLSVGFKL